MSNFIHKLADVQSLAIGDRTKVWQFVVILKGAVVGENCNINAHVFIENDVMIGNNVTIKSGVQIWNGVIIEDDAFIGPNVTFTNDLLPRSKRYPDKFEKTVVKKGASIGANATVIAGNSIGEYALIGAGSVLTKSVGTNELWIGNPARHVGFITDQGELLDMGLKSKCTRKKFEWLNNKLVQSD
ncbi:MAG: acyltransferase [Flavobacteriaceae bacterium]